MGKPGFDTIFKELKVNPVALYRCVSLQQFVSSDGLVQAGFAYVDVIVLGKRWEQGEERLRVHIVIIIHVTKPPEEINKNNKNTESVWVFFFTLI